MSKREEGDESAATPVPDDLDESLRELCLTQGLSEDKIYNKPHTVTSLDAFQAFRMRCDVVSHFSNLTEVCFVQMPMVTELAGFQHCPNLEKLWVRECKVKRIENLEHCTKLRHLDLDSNQIRVVEGLDTLQQLESLFLNDNRLTTLRGLSNLPNLTTLFVARNHVERVGTALDALTALTDLNLADNRIGYFKEIHNLTRLPALTTLCLNEPHYGDNPVCNLCNYQTYVLYQLAGLTCLDTLRVSEEAKALAEATYIKKKMYYNMRIKTLKRNTTNVVRRAAEALQARVGQINLNFNVLLRQLKEVQRLVEEKDMARECGNDAVGGTDTSTPSDDTPEFWAALAAKHDVLNDAIDTRSDEVADIEERFKALKERLMMISQQNITRMVVELGTGGNIRLEDGKPSDVWYSSCVELLHSRFFQRDFAPLGVKGVKVHRVTRVHNRFLRNRFDKRMSTVLGRNQSLGGGAGGQGKAPRRSLEYLFFSVPTHTPLSSPTASATELQRIAQEGFSQDHAVTTAPVGPLPEHAFTPIRVSYAAGNRRYAQKIAERRVRRAEREAGWTLEAHASGSPATGVPLTNSLSIADMPRLCQSVSAVLEHTGSWEPRHDTGSKQCEQMLNGAMGEGHHTPMAVNAARQAISDARGGVQRHMPVVGLQQDPARWLGDAGLDVDRSGTRLLLDELRARHPGAAASSSRPQAKIGGSRIRYSARGLYSAEVSSGVVMIAKVFLGNCQLLDERTGMPVDAGAGSDDDDGAGGAAPAAGGDGNADADAKLRHSVCRARSDDPKQRSWVALEPALVLPEYIIEYEYEWELPVGVQQAPQARSATMSSELAALAELSSGLTDRKDGSKAADGAIRLTPQAEADLRPLARPLASFVSDCRTAMHRVGGGAANGESKAGGVGVGAGGGAGGGGGGDSGAPGGDMDGLDMDPALPPRPKLDAITDAAILGSSPGASLSSIQYLNLHGNNIKVIEGLASCSSLRVLVLTFNEITRIDGLSTLLHLERLELGFNLIKRIEGLRGLARLRSLELNNNLLYQLEDLSDLRRNVPNLRHLNLRNNGLCDLKGYRSVVLSKLPHLEHLDGRPVSDADRATAEAAATRITPMLIKRHARSSTGAAFPVPPSAHDDDESDDGGDGGKVEWDAADDEWVGEVESLDLSHMRLRRLRNLERLERLRRADFADNELTTIEGLTTLTVLEELSLEENRISRMEGFDTLRFLKKLDLGKNRLTRIEGISSLMQLSQLSLEDNELVTLDGIGRLPALMELYIGNNKIPNIKEVLFLKELPKLIILDLSGNPLCAHATYRLYTVYHLRRLKVLDGVGVDSAEQSAARERYSGRLTAEFLEEKIGHAYFEAIRELDLASCRIREIEGLSGQKFRCLSYLNLDHNQLTGGGLAGLTQLPHLSVLRLNHNRISDLLPGCIAAPEGAKGNDVIPSGQPGGSVGSLARLEVLQLGFNQISDISALGLHRLPALKVLYLQGNDVARVSGLESCHSLRELVLDKNRIKYLDPTSVAGLTSLRELRLQENGLRSLSHLQGLVSVQVLALGFNRISDLPELDKLGSLPSLSELWLGNNPVARKQLYRPGLIKRLPALQVLDGREILPDERERAELLFSTDPRPSPMYVQDSRPVQVQGRVPVRLTSVNFESLTGYHRDGASGQAAVQQMPLVAHGVGGHGAGDDYRHQYGGADPRLYGGAYGGGGGATSAAAQASYVDSLLLPLARGGQPGGRPAPAASRAPVRGVRDASPLGFDRRAGRPGSHDRGGVSSSTRGYGGARSNGRSGRAGGASPRYFGRR